MTLAGALQQIPKPNQVDRDDTPAYVDLVLKIAQRLSSGQLDYTPQLTEAKYLERLKKDVATKDWILTNQPPFWKFRPSK